MLQPLNVEFPGDNGVVPLKAGVNLGMQGPDFSNHFSLDNYVELLASEVVWLARGSELVVATEAKMALLENKLKGSVGLSKKAHI